MNRSKSTLVLIEQLVVIAVFAICAAVCVFIIAVSFLMTREAVDTRNALTAAESAAERFKALGSDDTVRFYDDNWRPTDADGAAFILRLYRRDDNQPVARADILVQRACGHYLVSLSAAARRGVWPHE